MVCYFVIRIICSLHFGSMWHNVPPPFFFIQPEHPPPSISLSQINNLLSPFSWFLSYIVNISLTETVNHTHIFRSVHFKHSFLTSTSWRRYLMFHLDCDLLFFFINVFWWIAFIIFIIIIMYNINSSFCLPLSLLLHIKDGKIVIIVKVFSYKFFFSLLLFAIFFLFWQFVLITFFLFHIKKKNNNNMSYRSSINIQFDSVITCFAL